MHSLFFGIKKIKWAMVSRRTEGTLGVIELTCFYVDFQFPEDLQKYQLFLIFKRIKRNVDIFWIKAAQTN